MTAGCAVLLGIDAGGSGTKWHLRQGEKTLAQGRAAPLTTATLDLPQGKQVLRDLKAALPATPQAIHAGLPGLQRASERAAQVSRVLGEALNVPPAHVQVESDLDLAFHAHLQAGAGVLLYAGTGSIAYALLESGEVLRAGGRGYRIGDDGGGASIGRGALRWVADHLDVGVEPAGPLAAELRAVTGGLDWATLRAFVYDQPGAAALARLSPAVTRAVEAGDPVAQELLFEAATSLAELVRRIRQRAERPTWAVVATGGALRSVPLQNHLQDLLPNVRFQFVEHEVVASALATHLLE